MVICFLFVYVLFVFEVVVCYNLFVIVVEELCIIFLVLLYWICLLEDFVGECLFYCDGCFIGLFEFGCCYFDVVCSVLCMLIDFLMFYCNVVVQFKIKVMLLLIFVCYLFMLCIVDFIQCYFEIVVELYFLVLLYDLLFFESDVEICFGVGNYFNIIIEKLFEELVFVVVSFGYLKILLLMKLFIDLQYVILLCLVLEFWQLWFEVVGLKDWVEFLFGLCVDDLGLLLEVVCYGYGIGLMCQYFVEELLVWGEIVELFDVCLCILLYVYYVVYECVVCEWFEVDIFISWMQNVFCNI